MTPEGTRAVAKRAFLLMERTRWRVDEISEEMYCVACTVWREKHKPCEIDMSLVELAALAKEPEPVLDGAACPPGMLNGNDPGPVTVSIIDALGRQENGFTVQLGDQPRTFEAQATSAFVVAMRRFGAAQDPWPPSSAE